MFYFSFFFKGKASKKKPSLFFNIQFVIVEIIVVKTLPLGCQIAGVAGWGRTVISKVVSAAINIDNAACWGATVVCRIVTVAIKNDTVACWDAPQHVGEATVAFNKKRLHKNKFAQPYYYLNK